METPGSDRLVFSHPRSGTHFLGALLIANFRLPVSQVRVDRSYFAKEQPEFRGGSFVATASAQAQGSTAGATADSGRRSVTTDVVPWGEIVAHPHVHRFYENLPQALADHRVYIWRNPGDVLASVYRWKFLRNRTDQPLASDVELPFSEFLRRPLPWQESAHQPADRERTPLEHWLHHTSGWIRAGEWVVRYEEVVEDPTSFLEIVDERWGLERREEAKAGFLRVDDAVGYNPGPGAAGHADLWSDDDREYLERELARLAELHPAARILCEEAGRKPMPPPAEWAAHVASAVDAARNERKVQILERTCRELRARLREEEREVSATRDRYHRVVRELESLEARARDEGRVLDDFLSRLMRKASG